MSPLTAASWVSILDLNSDIFSSLEVEERRTFLNSLLNTEGTNDREHNGREDGRKDGKEEGRKYERDDSRVLGGSMRRKMRVRTKKTRWRSDTRKYRINYSERCCNESRR